MLYCKLWSLQIDPRNTSILMFPGQGSQFVGMASKLLQYPKVEELFDTASKILGGLTLFYCFLHSILNISVSLGTLTSNNKIIYIFQSHWNYCFNLSIIQVSTFSIYASKDLRPSLTRHPTANLLWSFHH